MDGTFWARGDLSIGGTMTANGRLGVGTYDPESALHVNGVRATAPVNLGIHMGSEGGTYYGMEIVSASFSGISMIDFTAPTQDFRGRIQYDNANNALSFYTNLSADPPELHITSAGDIGIGIKTPSSKLHVVGKLTTTAGAGFTGRVDIQTNQLYINGVVKAFDIVHPNKAKSEQNFRLRHRCIESDVSTCLYKYQFRCNEALNTFELPDYFSHLLENCLVVVSPFKHFGAAWGETRTDGSNKLCLTCSAPGIYNVFLMGDRKDKDAVEELDQYGIEYRQNKMTS